MTEPAHISAKRYRKTAAEHDIQAMVLEYLKLVAAPGVIAVAIPNAGKRTPAAAIRLKREGLYTGAADLCILLPQGRTAWLELKTSRGVQSGEQREFARRCEHLGHVYAVVRNLEDVDAILRKYGGLK